MILAGTRTGLVSFGPDSTRGRPAFEGRDVRALAPAGWKRLWAAVDGRRIWSTDDSGAWRLVASLDDLPDADGLEIRCLADTRANAETGILAGTSRARLVRVTGQQTLEVVPGFDRAPGRDRWHTPWGGPPDTRTITEDGNQVLVNVHVGGVLRSRDEGETWHPTIDIHADVHRVVTGHGRVYAAGARGLWVGENAGDDWRLAAGGLHATYCRSVAVCGDALLISASTGPGHGRAAVYRSNVAVDGFERCRAGLPEWIEGNVDSLCLDAMPDGRLAAFGTESGDLYASADRGSSWTRLATGLDGVHCVLTLP